MSTYDQIVSAVLNYYNSDSEIYKKVMAGGPLSVGEMNAVLSSVPYLQPVTSISGARVGIDAQVTFKEPVNPIEFVVGDSNYGGSSYGGSSGGVTGGGSVGSGGGIGGTVPGNASSDGAGGISISAGASKLGDTLKVIADKASLAVTGVNIGAKLGFKIDEALYENFPDFWEQAFGKVSPQDFANIFSEDIVGNKFLRTLFGIDENYYLTQYVPEEAIAATYQALRDMGVLSGAKIEPEIYPDQRVDFVIDGENIESTIARNIAVWATGANNPFTRYGYSANDAIYAFNSWCVSKGINPHDYVGSFASSQVTGRGNMIHKGSIAYTWALGEDEYGEYWYYTVKTAVGNPNYVSFVIGGNENGMYCGDVGAFQPHYYLNPTYRNGDFYITCSTSGMMMKESPAVDGISQMDDVQAPYPTPSPDVITGPDVPTILPQLKQAVPELFENPITVGVPQEDGTVTPITYYPIPWATALPSPLPTDSTGHTVSPLQIPDPVTSPDASQVGDPVTDPDTGEITYTDPKVNPQTAPQIIENPAPNPTTTPTVQPLPEPEISPDPSPDPSAPSIPPDNPTTPPNTGEGENDPITPVVGESNAMWAVYNPSVGQLNQFGAWLWSPNFIDNILRLFQSPMDGIIGIHKIYATPPRGGSQNITVGYLDSGVASTTVPSQYTEVDCGEIDMQEYFGNVFDYAPFTEVAIYLPFIGFAKLDVANVMRGRIKVKYGIDVYTGACLAMVQVRRDGFNPILYTFGGDCAVHYPVSSGSYSGIISSLIGAGASALTAVATGGMSAVGAAAMGAGLIANNKGFDVSHSGGLSGNTGAMGPKKPYIVIKRPQTEVATNVEAYDGKPANKTTAIGSCKGFVKCKVVKLTLSGAYGDELDEVKNLLTSGIYVT